MFKRILLAIDDSKPAARATEAAILLAQQVGGEIAAVHVVDSSRAITPELIAVDDHLIAELRKQGDRILTDAAALAPEGLKFQTFLLIGDPGECILSKAREWGAELIVIGSDSRGRLAHFLLGSTADSVIRRAACPGITVRAGAAIGADGVATHQVSS